MKTAALLLAFATAAQAQTLVRAPYLQKGSPNSASVCWRVSASAPVQIRYGTALGNLASAANQPAAGTDACADLTGLQPDTKYYYALYNGSTQLAGGEDHWIRTHPAADAKKRTVIWIVGDAGTGYADQAKTRDAWMKVNGGSHADVMLLLGDNAYQNGTDAELTKNHFAPYAAILRNSFSWGTLGNHDAYTADGAPHLAAWNLPTAGESGGVPSGSEFYFSFDHGNIHFICLDSQSSTRDRTKNGPMYKWLEADLTATRKDWIIAFFHHAPYTFGSHNSDVEEKHPDMRATFGPLMEKHGVDFVLSGHSHGYERSFLINGATGISSDNKAKMSTIALDAKSGDYTMADGPYKKADSRAGNQGTIYMVAGSGGQIEQKEVPEKHPVMYVEHVKLGTAQLIIEDQSAVGIFIDATGAILDRFAVVQAGGVVRSQLVMPEKGGLLFEKQGRNLLFAKKARGKRLKVWDSRGHLVFQGTIAGQMPFPSHKFRPGVYHYRSGTHEGSLLLD